MFHDVEQCSVERPSSSGEKRRDASVKNMRPSFATTTASAYRMDRADVIGEYVTDPSAPTESRPFMASARSIPSDRKRGPASARPVDHRLDARAIRVHAQHIARKHARVELAVGAELDVLRADLGRDRDRTCRCEPIVAGERALYPSVDGACQATGSIGTGQNSR